MSEENEKKPFDAQRSGQNGQKNGEHNKNRHRRRHRGGKHPPESSKQDVRNLQLEYTNVPSFGTKEKAGRADQNQRPHNHHGNGNRPRQKPEDIYGTPTENDALSLEELRARIVIKSAGGEKPTIHPQQKETPAKELSPAEISPDVLCPAPDIPTPTLPSDQLTEVIGVRFRSSGKVYYFDPKGKHAHVGQSVIVETARGSEFGEVSFGNRKVSKKDVVSPLRPLIRIATAEDIVHNRENRKNEQEALKICAERIRKHGLQMKLIDAQYAFDNSKLVFYFTSENRVDFRDLVKDLAGQFHTRIELRQIGIRDEAKLLGGLGACGHPLCCSTFLPDFVQVSIKMAKEQGLSLNSAKISGVCGRLMCCLRYETESYAAETKLTPPTDSIVQTPDGIGKVIGISPLAGTVRVLLKDTPDAPPKTYSRDDVTVIGKERRETGDKKS